MAHETPPPRRTLAALLSDYRVAFMFWRRRLKSRLPFVRRTVYRKLEARNRALITALLTSRAANDCSLSVVKDAAGELGPELCLFVTYSPLPRLKRHVVRHVEALRASGVKVILIVNTPLPHDRIELDPGFLDGLTGLFVRANEGFDFGAWAHLVLVLEDRLASVERLILTNDSIVGPLDATRLGELLARVRVNTADVIGLTENAEPLYHLQSFFLVFRSRALASAAFKPFWMNVRNLPTKELVIDLYETRLTEWLLQSGLTCGAMFRLKGCGGAVGSNDAYYRWDELVASGFPFVKASVLEEFWDTSAMKRLVPGEIRDGYEFANRRDLERAPTGSV